MVVTPFMVNIPDDELADLQHRLRATRWADDYGNEDWRYGVERGWLQKMVQYWANDFDWRAQEAAINAFPQFRTVIDDIPIHFVHVRGKGPKPTPIILTHGWPLLTVDVPKTPSTSSSLRCRALAFRCRCEPKTFHPVKLPECGSS
jgi:hypothetical protein